MSVARAGLTPALGAAVLPVYARQDLTFVRGEGTLLYDAVGRAYLDFLAGIAVVGLGHGHPAPLAAAHAQLDRLWHVSNLYWTEPMVELAERLSARAGGAQAFFCNSGSEAVEAGLKYARKATGCPGIVALNDSFHGRTAGALSVTGQPAKRTAFEPLLPHVQFAEPNDVASLEAAISGDTGCILLEPVQGEGGVHVLEAPFVAAARRLADESGAVLLFDEVQTGVGRTGSFFAYERLGVRPDALMLAKGLGNGLPIGCLLVLDGAPAGFAAGDHASTFGGNPVACAAAAAVCDELTDELLATVRANGNVLAGRLAELRGVREVRGAGLMLGAELERPPGDVVTACAERGLLVGTAGTNVLRLTPPLTVTTAEIEQALGVLEEVLA
jgi:acetylornithine/N-succinyldiaminopimelate aminotransferase